MPVTAPLPLKKPCAQKQVAPPRLSVPVGLSSESERMVVVSTASTSAAAVTELLSKEHLKKVAAKIAARAAK